jgi:hypothetical protein
MGDRRIKGPGHGLWRRKRFIASLKAYHYCPYLSETAVAYVQTDPLGLA